MPYSRYLLPTGLERELDERAKSGCGACGGVFWRYRERRTPSAATSEAFIYVAMIRLMVRRFARAR
jgi:hypothetical protein